MYVGTLQSEVSKFAIYALEHTLPSTYLIIHMAWLTCVYIGPKPEWRLHTHAQHKHVAFPFQVTEQHTQLNLKSMPERR